jgi:hypothetical protein
VPASGITLRPVAPIQPSFSAVRDFLGLLLKKGAQARKIRGPILGKT